MRAHLNPSLMENDRFVGRQGQRFFVYSALTQDAGRDLLSHFGLDSQFAPLLLTSDLRIITQPGAIIVYMIDNGMISRENAHA